MPFQGNDNRSTRSWMPQAAVAPSRTWNSTYAVHYRNPAKRNSNNHEYWLRKASQRAEATAQLSAQGLSLEPRSHTFRNPSLALAFNQPLRNPSSLARERVPGNAFGATQPGSLTARPLASSIRDTSVRSHNNFDAYAAQQNYGSPYNVSALSMLEGQAAASHSVIPNQATARPHVERAYRGVGGGHQPLSYGSTARPQSARPAQSLTYRAPEHGAHELYASLGPQAAWSETLPVVASPSQQQLAATQFQSSYRAAETRPPAGYTVRERSATPVERSQTFRPQINSPTTGTIPANVLLSQETRAQLHTARRQHVAAAPARYTSRAAEWQGGAYQELEL